MFEEASDQSIDRLKTSRDVGLAIRAAWEAVRRTMTADRLGTDEPVRIDPKVMQRFLGSLKGDWVCIFHCGGKAGWRKRYIVTVKIG